MGLKTKTRIRENDLIINKKYVVFIQEFFEESERLLKQLDVLSLAVPQLKDQQLQKIIATLSAGIEIQPAMFIASILQPNKNN